MFYSLLIKTKSGIKGLKLLVCHGEPVEQNGYVLFRAYEKSFYDRIYKAQFYLFGKHIDPNERFIQNNILKLVRKLDKKMLAEMQKLPVCESVDFKFKEGE